MRRPAAFFLLALFCAGMQAAAQPAHLVKDVNVIAPPVDGLDHSAGQEVEAVSNVLFFTFDDGVHGLEIWKTDGTSAGTRLVKDLCPGVCDAAPQALTASQGLLFFTAEDGAHGRELWRTDGTAAGTVLLADVEPGLGDGFLSRQLIDAGSVLFFADRRGGLWKSDGTPAGTQLVKSFPSFPFGRVLLLAAAGGKVLFGAWDGVAGAEPWLSDGTEAGTISLGDLNPGLGDSIATERGQFEVAVEGVPAAPAPQGGFYFPARDGTPGLGLWHTDGTASGTVHIKTLDFFRGLTAVGNTVFFAGQDEAGLELWKTDGTEAGTVRVKDIRPGFESSIPLELTAAGDRLFFRAEDGVHSGELWKSDGTEAGTVMVVDFNTGANHTFNDFNGLHGYGLSAMGNGVVYLGFSLYGQVIFRSDGTAAGTVLVDAPGLDIPGWTLRPDTAVAMNGRLYFFGGVPATEIWSTDGTLAGTTRIRDLETTGPSAFSVNAGRIALARSFGALGDVLFFQADDSTHGAEPWRSDGTPGGTWQVADIQAFPPNTHASREGSFPHGLTTVNGGMVFIAHDATFVDRIWSSDGTAAGTQPVSPSGLNGFIEYPQPNPGGPAFFTTSSFSSGGQLWTTDGTPAGTVQIQDFSPYSIYFDAVSQGKAFFSTRTGFWVSDGTPAGTVPVPGAENFPALWATDAGSTLFFFRQLPGAFELWKTDGTETGTVFLKTLSPSTQFFDNLGATATGRLFFLADDPATGAELWTSDGTPEGTGLVKDIFPGTRGAEPLKFKAVGNRAYFVADDGVHGRELWVSDGTAAGTHLVADVFPGPDSSVPANLAAVSDTLLFSATDGVHGVELWRTEGAALGTRMVGDIAPGALSSSPMEMTAAGSNVFFAANDNSTGFEPWAVPQSNVLALFGDVPTTYFARRFVEALAIAGVTSGCGGGDFCPGLPVSRAQAAVFLLASRGGAVPPATGTRFQDVPAGYWAGPWIEELANEGIAGGCSTSPPLFCPNNNLTRAEMAVMLLATRGITPPPATGTRFADVPANYWAAPWIEELARQGITSGCDSANYCPGQPVTRGQMAVFLVVNFGLPLP